VAQDLPGAVLFACSRNRVRSPMALGLFKLAFGDRIFVDSCGVRVEAGEEADPFAVAVMDELGFDLSGHVSKTFDDLDDDSFDLIITLTPEAHHRALEFGRTRAVAVEYWPTPDPTLAQGSRDEVLSQYRDVRERLAARIRARFERPVTFGG